MYMSLFFYLFPSLCLFSLFSSTSSLWPYINSIPRTISLHLLCFNLYFFLLDIDMAGYKRSEESAASSQEHENSSMDKKYGGLMPKKKPLISKDPERAFFDSADWALCKQGAGANQKTMVDIETLRPKLQRTPHQQLPPRRPACTS